MISNTLFLEIGPTALPKINILFCPHHNIGSHFIDWSVYFLSGQDQYFDGSIKRQLSIDFPVGSKNFHHHNSLAAWGFVDLKEKINLASESQVPVTNIYLSPLILQKIIKLLHSTSIDLANKTQMDQANEYLLADIQDALAWLQQSPYPLSFFDLAKDDYLHSFYNDRAPLEYLEGIRVDSIDESLKSYTDTFFPDLPRHFDQNIWDRREQLALVICQMLDKSTVDYSSMLDQKKPYLYYNTDDIWNNFQTVTREMLDFFDLPIVEDRVEKWTTIYNKWRTNHDPCFSRHYDRILEAIVNNKYVNLRRFNLNFYKEVLIQHGLITRYNLNLKTWQLTTFPSDTLELHKLLELNIHKL